MPAKGRKGLPKRTHGRSKTPEYRRWAAMLSRCRNPNDASYYLYGARGIVVCDEWQAEGGFEKWLAEVGPLPSPDHSLDRIDNAKPYEPGNIRWATAKEQAANTRQARLHTVNGETHCLNEWARRRGMKPAKLHGRLRHGWTINEALELE